MNHFSLTSHILSNFENLEDSRHFLPAMALLTDLPPELLLEIINQSDYDIDLCALAQTCRLFFDLTRRELDLRIRNNFRPRKNHTPHFSTALCFAAKTGNLDCVRRILHVGISIESTGPPNRGESPIAVAANGGHKDIVQALLDYGADPTSSNDSGPPQMLTHALVGAIYGGHESIVKLLVDRGMRLVLRYRGLPSKQPLTFALEVRNVSMIKLLLDYGCSPLTRDHPDLSDTAWRAAMLKNLEVLQMFMDRGFVGTFSGPDRSERWPLIAALVRNDIPMVKFLCEHGVDPLALSDWEMSVTKNKSVREVVRAAVLQQTITAAGRNPEHADWLLKAIHLEEKMKHGSLHEIVCITTSAVSGMEDLLRDILKIDLKTRENWDSFTTPDQLEKNWKDLLTSQVTFAASRGHVGILEQLLDHGADPNGMTKIKIKMCSGCFLPIFSAADKGHVDIVKLLLERGADPFPRHRTSLFDRVARCKDVDKQIQLVQLILERDILMPKPINAIEVLKKSVNAGTEIFELLVDYLEVGSQIGSLDYEEVFNHALQQGRSAIVERFLQAGFDISGYNEWGERKLKEVILSALPSFHKLDQLEPTLDILLQYGLADGEVPRDVMPPLGCPSNVSFSATTIRLLLKKGSDPIHDCEGRLFGNKDQTFFKKARNPGDLFQRESIRIALELLDERNVPFGMIKSSVKEIARTPSDPKMVELLWRWYWRKVYPPPIASCHGVYSIRARS